MSKVKKKRFWAWLFLLVLILPFYKCGNDVEDIDDPQPPRNIYISEVVPDAKKGRYILGEKIPATVKIKDTDKLEEIAIAIDGKPVLNSKEKKAEFSIELLADSIGLGQHRISFDLKVTGNEYGEHQWIDLTILSNTKPVEYGCRVITKYPHDQTAFTQGLFIEKGMMYEGTGQKGQSDLRFWDFRQGRIIKSVPLGPNYFGEGIAMVDDKIYQLTYTEGTCFVYDKKTLTHLKTFNYPTQGWGLTYDGKHLILTDGSHYLYYYEPENFTLVKKVQVCDDKGMIVSLNELELIDGELWANVWMTDEIVQIDPQTGRVLSRMNCENLLTLSEKTAADVLNGIAYDPATKKIYVTGKYWPWLFEIVKVEKNS